MKFVIFGHSYVRDLESLGHFSMSTSKGKINIEYSSRPGANIDTYLKDPTILEEIADSKPDIVLAIVGGNSIVNGTTNHELCVKLREFYKILRHKLPHALIIAAQVEQRFYKENNRFNAPQAEEFKARRRSLNTAIKRIKDKDNVLIVSGTNRLDHEVYYRDGVHLNKAGLKNYMSIVKTTVVYALDNRK